MVDQTMRHKLAGLVVLALVCAAWIPSTAWLSSGPYHTLTEVVAAVLAAVVGVVALTNYAARRSNFFLLLGVGFLGTFALDAYHAVVTSAWFSLEWKSSLPSLIPWSWSAPRTMLGILMLFSVLVHDGRGPQDGTKELPPKTISAIVGGLTLACFALFAFVPLPRAYYPEYFIGRPQEIIVGAFFAVALFMFLQTKAWAESARDYWIVLSLAVGVATQIIMSRSYALFDGAFDAAHILKIVSYTLVLVGLLIDLYGTYCRVDVLNRDLAGQVETRTLELKRSNEDLEQFAYVASHDLKAPLRAIDNLSCWLEEDLGDSMDEGNKHKMTLLRGRVSRMEKLLDDLLDYSRAGRKKHQVEDVCVLGIVKDVSQNLLAMPEGFEFEVDGTMPTLSTERTPLEQVFRNLISNAVKHHPGPSGKIRVHLAEQNQKFATFVVEDNGGGIPENYRRKVFDLFTTLQARDSVEGSGMGLAMVRRLVSRHGGNTWIEAAEPHGTKVFFQWPITISER